MIEAMAKDKPANKNIVIVLSDGAYNVNVTYDKHGNKVYGNELLKTGGEKVSNVTSKANELKSSTSKPIVYSIAIVGQNESSGNTIICELTSVIAVPFTFIIISEPDLILSNSTFPFVESTRTVVFPDISVSTFLNAAIMLSYPSVALI